MALKTSLVITGDSASATTALRQVEAGLDAVDGAAQTTGATINSAMMAAVSAIAQNTGTTNQLIAAMIAGTNAARQKADAVDEVARAMRAAAQAANDNARADAALTQQASSLRAAIDPMYAAQQRFNQQMDVAEELLKAGAIAEREYAAAIAVARQQLQDHARAVAGNGTAVDQAAGKNKQAAAGYINLGRQMQDVAVMAQGGMSLGSIISTQGGQIADAVQQMGGRFSGLASFLAGPWGAAVIVGTSLLANFASGLLHTGEAAEDELGKLKKNAQQTDATRRAKEIFAKSEDGVRNAILDQKEALDKQVKSLRSAAQQALETANANYANEMKIRNATKAMLEQALAQEAIAAKNVSKGGDGTVGGDEAAFGALQGTSKRTQLLTEQLKQQNAALAAAASSRTTAQSLYDVEEGKKAADPLEAIKKKYEGSGGLIEQARQRAVAEGLVGAALQQQVAEISKQEKAEEDAARKRRKKPNDPTASAIKLEDGAEQRLAKLANQYADLPSGVQKANAALLDLNAIQKEITERAAKKGGGVINVAKWLGDIQTVRDAINQQMTKPFEDYIKKGAEAAQVNKLAAAGREDEAAALQVIFGLQEKMNPLSAEQTEQVLKTVQAQREQALVLRDQRALIQANVQAVTSMRTALQDTVANALKGRMSAANVLASIGNSYVNIMSQRITESLFGDALRSLESQAGDGFQSAMGRASTNVTSFADAVLAATAKINGAPVSAGAAASVGKVVETAEGGIPVNYNVPANDNQEIAVTAKPKTNVSGAGGVVTSLLSTAMRGLGISVGQGLQDKLLPVFTRLEKRLPDALQGAFTGNTASKLILGSGSSSVGSSVGGAIGQKMGEKFLSKGLETIASGLGQFAGPLGSVLGGVVGGMLGDLFTPTKAGTTVITSTSKDASTTASTSEVQAGLSNISTSIQSSLDAIASKFSTTVGDFSVSIGQYKDYFRVSASGSSHVGDKYYPNGAGSDILYDGTDTAAAVMIAIQNAIADGAIRGLSSAVQKALASSSNIERAVAEALKVQEVELAIGGLGATMEKSFKDLDAKAAERVRIAKDYGFDLLKVEQVNAEKRLALQKSLLKEQVGSLQDLITEMTSGSLFEGSLVDQRAAILAKIDAAKADVAAGKDGAGDALAKLLEQLNTVSRDAYGTTGNFATDRTLISDTARDAIASANAAIQAAADAAAATMTASDTTATQLDEANDQLAKIASALGLSLDYLKAIAANGNIASSLKDAAGY